VPIGLRRYTVVSSERGYRTVAKLLFTIFALSAALLPQDGAPPVRILQGELLEWTVISGTGDFKIRDLDRRIHYCRIIPETFITRQSHRISHVGVRPGDTLEVIADLRRGESQCMAVTVYVRPPDAAFRFPRLLLPNRSRFSFLDNLYQRGNLTFAGVVVSHEDSRLVLKTRYSGNLSFQLRPDTVYSTGGREVDAKLLEPQMRVYVRAGSAFGGDLEAFQITWGEILNPR